MHKSIFPWADTLDTAIRVYIGLDSVSCYIIDPLVQKKKSDIVENPYLKSMPSESGTMIFTNMSNSFNIALPSGKRVIAILAHSI